MTDLVIAIGYFFAVIGILLMAGAIMATFWIAACLVGQRFRQAPPRGGYIEDYWRD